MNAARYVPRSPRATGEDWGDAASALSMVVDEHGALTGLWNGRIAVRALHRCVSEQTRVEDPFRTGPTDGPNWHYETGYSYITSFEARLDPALCLALLARQVPPVMPNRTSFDPSRGAEVEKHFAFYGFDREHTQEVLAAVMDEVLRDANVAITPPPGAPAPGTYNLMLTDVAVTALSVVRDYIVDVEVLRDGITRVGRVAEALLAAREAHLARGEASARAEWAATGSALGLAADGLRIAGQLRGFGVSARATVEPSPDPQRLPTHLSTRVDVTFRSPLGCGASLTAQAPEAGLIRGLLNKVFGGQDILVGDAQFDAAFIVRGTTQALRARLTAQARERLLAALALAPSLVVTDEGLGVCVPELIVRRGTLEALVRAVVAAAEALDA